MEKENTVTISLSDYEQMKEKIKELEAKVDIKEVIVQRKSTAKEIGEAILYCCVMIAFGLVFFNTFRHL